MMMKRRVTMTSVVAAALGVIGLAAMTMTSSVAFSEPALPQGARLITPKGIVETDTAVPRPVVDAPPRHRLPTAARAEQPMVVNTSYGEVIVPRVRVIQWNDSVARFDTQTGAIHRFNGELDKPNVRGEWISHVPPIREATSGLLEIQTPHGVHALEATFLVDVITGETWLLRRRGSNAAWDHIDTFR